MISARTCQNLANIACFAPLSCVVPGNQVPDQSPSEAVWTGGLATQSRRLSPRQVILGLATGAAIIVISLSVTLWLVAVPSRVQQDSWYWLQARVFHTDAGDRLLTAIEHHDKRLFESAVSQTCGDGHDTLCLVWHDDKSTYHRHWGQLKYKNGTGDQVSVWNVNRLAQGASGPEEIIQAWGFVYDNHGLIKQVI
jgi:hypothetical protein